MKIFRIFWPSRQFSNKYIEEIHRTTTSYQLFPEVEKVIKELKRRGKCLSIISNRNQLNLKEGLKKAKLDKQLFLYIQGCGGGKFQKPDPCVFNGILRKLAAKGITQNQILYIGDVADDFETSIRAGIQCLIVPRGALTKTQLIKRGVPKACFIKSLNELLKI